MGIAVTVTPEKKRGITPEQNLARRTAMEKKQKMGRRQWLKASGMGVPAEKAGPRRYRAGPPSN